MILSKLQSLELYDVINEYGFEPSEIREKGEVDKNNTLYFFHLDDSNIPIHIGDIIEILKDGITHTGELVNIENGKFSIVQLDGNVKKIKPTAMIDFDAFDRHDNYVIYIWLYNLKKNNHIKIIKKNT